MKWGKRLHLMVADSDRETHHSIKAIDKQESESLIRNVPHQINSILYASTPITLQSERARKESTEKIKRN